MLAEKEKVMIYIERAKKDYEEEKLKNEEMQKKLINNDGNVVESNDKLRSQIEKMKNEMNRINNYSIDIARDPAKAI
jgi:hypothetical protein